MRDPISDGRFSVDSPWPLRWWRALPLADPVERRNGLMLQTVLVLSALLQALGLLLAWSNGVDPLAVGMALLNVTMLLACLALLRRGAFIESARLFVTASLALLGIAYVRWGLALQAPQQLLQLVPVLIGGALLGRRALWATVAWLALLVIVGGWRDAGPLVSSPRYLLLVGQRVLACIAGFGLTAFVLDQVLTGLRENLALARHRGNALSRSRDRLQLEMQEKERQRDQLVHAQKMESIGRLSSGIAHDFNHLLTLVLGHAERGRASATLDEAHAALLDVQSAARRAAAVSRRLLDFGRMEDARPEVFDPAEAIEEMRPMLRQLFSARTALELRLQPSPGLIRFDRAQLELILLTLAANAEHAMPDGGRFTIALGRSGPGLLQIAASDTGHGMSAEVRERCLEPFFTTKPSGQGTGLGLAVAASLVQAAGGAIAVDSAPGQGATIRVALPLAARAIGSGVDPNRIPTA
ncbi:MAG: ATP-binding protein [Pseudoxanthomonas sp.]